jgi:predicted metal-dependent hydrolase
MFFQVGVSLLFDRATYKRGNLRKSWKKFRTAKVVSREIWDQLKDYNRPDFHPDDRDTTGLVEQWRAELFGDEGSLNDKLVRTAVA